MDTREKWNSWVASHEHAQFLQSYEWGVFQQSLGREVVYIAPGSSDAPMGEYVLGIRLPLWYGASYLYFPRGPLGSLEWALEHAPDAVSNMFIRYEPAAFPEGKTRHGSIKTRSIQPDHEWVVDTTSGYNALFAAMHQKTRYNVRLASKKGVQVRIVSEREQMHDNDAALFYQLLRETATTHTFRLHSENYYRQLIDFFTPKSPPRSAMTPFCRLFFAEYSGTAVAAILILYFGDTGVYLHGGSSRAHRELMAPYLLHDRALADTRALGYRYYNFGGIAPAGIPSHPFNGITRFKKGFGGESLVYPGTFDYPLRTMPYLMYTIGRALRNTLSSFNG